MSSRASFPAIRPPFDAFRDVIEVIEMHNHTEWEKVYEKYYTPEQRADMQRRADPQRAAEGTRQWNELIAEVD